MCLLFFLLRYLWVGLPSDGAARYISASLCWTASAKGRGSFRFCKRLKSRVVLWNYCKKISRREVEPQKRQVKWIWCSFIHSFIEWRLCSGDTNTFRILPTEGKGFSFASLSFGGDSKPSLQSLNQSVQLSRAEPAVASRTTSRALFTSDWHICLYFLFAWVLTLLFSLFLAVCISSVFVLFAIAAPCREHP